MQGFRLSISPFFQKPPIAYGLQIFVVQCLLLVICIITYSSCYEPKSACLDIRATNYDVDADDPCGDCCTYPHITLAIQHSIELPNDTVSFKYGTLYPSSVQPLDSFVVDRARFFLYDLKLVTNESDTIEVVDSLQLTNENGEMLSVRDCFAKLDRDIFQSRNIGTILQEGVITDVVFSLGLPESLLDHTFSGIPSSHPLSTSDTLSFVENEGYVPILLTIRRDTLADTEPETMRFYQSIPISLHLEQPFVLDRGFHSKITIQVEYSRWFKEVDFENDSQQTMKEKIEENLSNVFSVTQIVLE